MPNYEVTFMGTMTVDLEDSDQELVLMDQIHTATVLALPNEIELDEVLGYALVLEKPE